MDDTQIVQIKACLLFILFHSIGRRSQVERYEPQNVRNTKGTLLLWLTPCMPRCATMMRCSGSILLTMGTEQAR